MHHSDSENINRFGEGFEEREEHTGEDYATSRDDERKSGFHFPRRF